MNFEKHKKLLNQELEQFSFLLSEVLPRYIFLVRKKDINPEELKELGDIEHFLIDINGKIAAIKHQLDHDLFGETMELYYEVKGRALKGDPEAQKQFVNLRKLLMGNIKGDSFFNWN